MNTSYFDNKKLDYRSCVSVAYTQPSYYKGRIAVELIPSKKLINTNCSVSKWEDSYYIERLQFLDPEVIYEKYKNLTLICWEKPNEFCHRRIIAKWIESKMKIIIPEISYEKKQEQMRFL